MFTIFACIMCAILYVDDYICLIVKLESCQCGRIQSLDWTSGLD